MRHLAILPLLLAISARSAFADARADEVLARARAAERAQMSALAGTTLRMQTRGTVRQGAEQHTLEALRQLAIGSDGSVRCV